MRKVHLYGATALVVMATVAAAPSYAAGKKVCYAFQDLSTGFWGAGHAAIVTTLEKNGVQVIELNGGKDANRQLEQVKDCIAQGADGIILTADDSDSETTLVALAQEADVPIATNSSAARRITPRRSGRRPLAPACRRGSCPWSGSTPPRLRGRARGLRRDPCRTRSSREPTSDSGRGR